MVQKNKNKLLIGYKEFFIEIMQESGEILRDLNDLIDLIKSLTSASIRSIRFASTIAILHILLGLIELEKKYIKKLQTTSSFILESKKNSQRSQDLKKEELMLKEDLSYIKKHIKDILTDILLIRYQDVMYEIRIQCINIMEKIMESAYNEKIIESVLKLTYDRKSEIRANILKLLAKSGDNFQYFKERVLEMCFDLDDKCCSLAIDLCNANNELLDKDEINKIIELAWVENESIRDSAFRFIVNVYFNNKLPIENSESMGIGLDQGKYLTIEKALISLIGFFLDGLDRLVAYAGNAGTVRFSRNNNFFIYAVHNIFPYDINYPANYNLKNALKI